MEVVNKIIMKKLNEIKPYFKNPRKNDKTVEMLVKVIPQVGFNVPILIDKDGVIVKGHARYKAAFKLGMEEVPCVITTATPEQINLDRITDNRISELSEWMEEGLLHELDALDVKFNDILGDLDLKTDVLESVFDDTSFEEIENEHPDLSDEEKQKIYEEMIAKKEAEEQARIAERIKKAEEEKIEDQLPQKKKYIKCVCGKCGEVFYIELDKAVIIEM